MCDNTKKVRGKVVKNASNLKMVLMVKSYNQCEKELVKTEDT